jgi:hypothetical protein
MARNSDGIAAPFEGRCAAVTAAGLCALAGFDVKCLPNGVKRFVVKCRV